MGKKPGGIHVGRPHVSKRDPKVHTTVTTRAGSGKIVKKQHRSNLGGIGIGAALFGTPSRKSGGKKRR